MKGFNDYKATYRSAIRQVLAVADNGRLDESAFPAYSHRNPVINWLFWQRLHKVMDHIKCAIPYENVLDFGCGSGVMLPYLSKNSLRVVAFDNDLLPLEHVQKLIPLDTNVEVVDGSKIGIKDLPNNSFDLILALDVLEHVEDLPQTIRELFASLKRGGQLVVSGPTENIFYRIGRKVAGAEYSGVYHQRNIADIKAEVLRNATVEPISTLYWPVPLFEIFAARKK